MMSMTMLTMAGDREDKNDNDDDDDDDDDDDNEDEDEDDDDEEVKDDYDSGEDVDCDVHAGNYNAKSNRPFYRFGGHIELIRFKEYYRMPRGHEHISFVFSSAFRDIFS